MTVLSVFTINTVIDSGGVAVGEGDQIAAFGLCDSVDGHFGLYGVDKRLERSDVGIHRSDSALKSGDFGFLGVDLVPEAGVVILATCQHTCERQE